MTLLSAPLLISGWLAAVIFAVIALWLGLRQRRPQSQLVSNATSNSELVVETMADGIVLIKDGEIQSMNHMAGKITGYEPNHCDQIDAENLFGDAIALRHQFIEPKEFSIRRANGQQSSIELSIRVAITDDEPLLIVTIRDLTELKRAQTLLVQQAHIIEKTDTLVFVANEANELEWCNPRFEVVTGYKLSEVSGQQATDILLGAGSSANDVQTIMTSIDQCVPYQVELLLYNKAGRPFWARIDVHPLYTELGAIKKWVGLGFDTTEQRYAAQMQVEFISMVSHELRTPLTVVSGALEALSMKATDCTPEMIEMMVDMGQRNCQQLDNLICDLLDINKLQSDTLTLKCENISLVDLAQRTVNELQSLAKRRDISLEFQNDQQCAPVFADPMRVTQVLSNLISNAIKFSPMQTEIVVSVSNLGHLIRTSVTDQGRGIPESFQPMVFRQFSRDPGVEAEGTEGFGLGLSICKRLLEHMDGTIDFDSTVNQGSCFFFDLPASQTASLLQTDAEHTVTV